MVLGEAGGGRAVPPGFFFFFHLSLKTYLEKRRVDRINPGPSFSHAHPAGSDKTGLYSVLTVSRVSSQVCRSNLLAGGGGGRGAVLVGKRPRPGAVFLSGSVMLKAADGKQQRSLKPPSPGFTF